MSSTGTIVDGRTERPNKWKGRLTLAATVAVLAASGVTLAILKPWSKPPPVSVDRLAARVELAAGEVTLVLEEGTRKLLSGTPLPETAALETAAGARALIRLSDGSRVYLDESTRIVVEGGIRLERGRAWLDAPPLDRGREPATHRLGEHQVTLSDGGASLELRDGKASIYVAEGLAVVSSEGGRTEVAAGERADVDAGAPSVSPVAFWEDWTGGMGDRAGAGGGRASGSGALYAVDRKADPGTPSLPLSIQRQSVKVVVRDSIAETLVDQRFFNPSGRDVEGYYWFTIPEGSQLVGFALETNGQLVEGEIVERKEASTKYEQAARRGNDPAMLEWVDDRTVRARIFPVPTLGTRRIVIRYQQLLSEVEGKVRYTYPLAGPASKDAPTIEEFALAVDLGQLATTHQVATLGEARLEAGGNRVTMRRSGYTPRADFQLELSRREDAKVEPIRLSMIDPGGDQARYVMLRYAPEVDFEAVTPKGEVVVVVDTSAAGDSSEHETRLAVAEALLRSLSEGDRFAVMTADVTAEVLYPTEGLAEASPEAISEALEKLGERTAGGATDLGAIFEQALERVHGLEQPAVVYVGDGMATSGERGGDALAERLRRSMTGSRARLFTVGVGHEIDGPLLDRLARVGGGDSSRVELPQQAVSRALALSGSLKTPTLTDLQLELGEGLDDLFMSQNGKLSRGQELVVLARTHHDLPEEITVRGRLGGEVVEATHAVVRDQGLTSQLVPRLWAGAYVERLLGDPRGAEAVRGKILSLGLEYGLMTPYTSYLALDSEQAYANMGIQRRSRPLSGTRLTANSHRIEQVVSPSVVPASRGADEVLVGILSAPFGCASDEPPRAAAEKSADAVQTAPASTPAPTPVAGADGAAANRMKADEAGAADDMESMDAPAKQPASPEPMTVSEEEAPPPPGVAKGEEFGRPAGKKRAPRRRAGSLASTGRGGGGEAVLGGVTGENERTGKSEGRDEDRKRAAYRSVMIAHVELPCSDASARRLGHRRVLWSKRLRSARTIADALRAYEASAGSCEVRGWKDERTFLQLLQARVATEQDVADLLGHFSHEPDAATYLSRALLRRLVDPALIAAVQNAVYGDAVWWGDVDRDVALAPDVDAKLVVLREAMARAPGDPAGERRLLKILLDAGRLPDAIARGNRLRDQGLMTPGLAQVLGEALVASGDEARARRVFSEIVEFDPDSPRSRQLLGDIFLRHSWYDQSYRQYEDLVSLSPDSQAAAIRLARAAAGAERTDEALRLLRKVAAGEGRPGVDDPRRFARLHAAALLGLLFHGDLGGGQIPKDALTRELRRLQLFEGASTWTLVLWDDLEVPLTLTGDGPEATAAVADAIGSPDTGLLALQAPPSGLPPLRVRSTLSATRSVHYRQITITFDGKAFEVEVKEGDVAPEAPPAPTPPDPGDPEAEATKPAKPADD